MEPGAAAAAAVEAALAAGAGDAEAYVQESTGREVRVHGGGVESLSAATERGIGLRAWSGGRVGYAYGSDLSAAGLRDAGERAAVAAGLADEDAHAGVPPAAQAEPAAIERLYDPRLGAWPTDRVVELALQLERAAIAAADPVRAVETAVYADSSDRVALVSSSGFAGEYEASSAYAYAYALAGDAATTETGLGFGLGRSPADLDAEAIGAEAGGRAAEMLGASRPPSRSCAVVLDPNVAASFAGLIGSVLCADAVQRGRSPFAGRLGDEVAGAALTLRDDGTRPLGLASSPFDDEGMPRRPTPLIEGGQLQAFLYDTYTARRDGAASTANAGRSGYRSAPGVAPSNLVVDEGDDGLEALLSAAGDGIYVNGVAGLHSGVNPVSGTFSVGASGRLVRGGELAEPVREFTIAGDLLTMLAGVRSTGDRARWVPFGGSVLTPHLLIGEMAIGGG